jgi:hypothetical protein
MPNISILAEVQVPEGNYCCNNGNNERCRFVSQDSNYYICNLFSKNLDDIYSYYPVRKCHECRVSKITHTEHD